MEASAIYEFMSNYIPPPRDPNYVKRKIYTQNTIKVHNETNPNGQFNIEVSSIDADNRMIIKQYQLFPEQLRMLLERNNSSSNPSQVQYINNNGSFSNITNYSDTINQHERVSNHPEYSNQNNPSAYHSFKNTMYIKNGNTVPMPHQENSNISGYSNEYSNTFGSFTSSNNSGCNSPSG